MINRIYIYASHSILYLCEHVISKVRYSLRGFSFSLDLKHWRITVVFLLLSNIIIWLSSRPCLWRLTHLWDIPLADLAISQYQILYVKMMLKLFHGGLSLLEFYKLHVWRIECTACEFCACCVHIYLSFNIHRLLQNYWHETLCVFLIKIPNVKNVSFQNLNTKICNIIWLTLHSYLQFALLSYQIPAVAEVGHFDTCMYI